MKFSSIYKLINQVSLLFPDKRINKSLFQKNKITMF